MEVISKKNFLCVIHIFNFHLGCPHMTCSSCSCEFCYLCGRRYVKIPIIGQHNNKFRFDFLEFFNSIIKYLI